MADRKLQQVRLASYNYRHEAEFAAGFLRDAGIPFLLQIEDPALGLSATNSATIWVTAVDEERARRVLDHEMIEGDAGGDDWAEYASEELARPAEPSVVAVREGSAVTNRASDLSLRARATSLVGGIGLGSALLLDGVRQSPLAWWAVVIVAALLAISGLVGRAPAPLRGILQALSGDPP